MIKHRLIAFTGFALGIATILISSPPSLFTAPADLAQKVDPIEAGNENTLTSPEDSSPTPDASTNQNTGEVSETPDAIPTDSTIQPDPTTSVVPTIKPTTSPTVAISTKTIIGDAFEASKYGIVQVQIVMTNGVVTSAKALLFPDADSRSLSISTAAIPVLIEQTIAAKNSAGIQGASGASYTSAAWIDSLASALAKA
jgi:uncharacterized protein with FMN-binding domain